MFRNSIWVSFLLIVSVISLVFLVKAGYQVYGFFQLDTQIPVTIERWEVREVKADQFVVIAFYTYAYANKNYEGSEQLKEFPNPWAANRAKQKFEKQDWKIWIHPKSPGKGSLEKKFPYKTAFSAFVLLGVTIYFFVLGAYAEVKNGK